MTRDDIIRLAREAGLQYYEARGVPVVSIGDVAVCDLERFAALVAAAEREKVAAWMIARGYATGHGDTIENLLAELEWQIADGWNRALMNGVKTEREACAKVCDRLGDEYADANAADCALAIRERGAP